MGIFADIALPWIMATTFLAIKLINVACGVQILTQKYRMGVVPAIIAAWLLVLSSQVGVVLLLSSFAWMQQAPLVGIWLTCSIVLWSQSRVTLTRRIVVKITIGWAIPLVLTGLVLGAMWLRSAFLFDMTWDGQTYGLPRLILWMQAKSVLIHMDAPQINLFTNEWIAEINMLTYAVWCGDYLGWNFGNLELLLLFVVSVFWIVRRLGVSDSLAFVVAVLLMTTPAIIGLSTAAKGDLLACVALCIGFGWLLEIRRNAQPHLAFCFLTVALSLALSAKISTALLSILLFLWAVASLNRTTIRSARRSWLAATVVAVMASLVLLSRFWVNWWVYGDPIKRVDGESAAFLAQNALGNLQIALNQLFPWGGLWDGTEAWALSGNMGLSVWILLILAALAGLVRFFIRRDAAVPRTAGVRIASPSWLALFVSTVALLTVLTMGLGVPQMWTFRYFLPGLLIAILVACGPLAWLPRRVAIMLPIQVVLCAVVIAQCMAAVKFGEIVPFAFGRARVELEKADTALKRATIKLPFTYVLASIPQLKLDEQEGLRVLAYQATNTAILPFMGSRAQNSMLLVRGIDSLLEQAKSNAWDAIVVSTLRHLRPAGLNDKLVEAGYMVAADNEMYVIALPRARVHFGRKISLDDIEWQSYGMAADVRIPAGSGGPELENPVASDIGFVSQPLTICGVAEVEASIEGHIASADSHAAHLSVYGQTPLLLFSSGTYHASIIQRGVAPLPCIPYRLAFGLGGWSTGQGRLRLVELRIRQFEISGPSRRRQPQK